MSRLLLTDIRPNPRQPRKIFDETALGELASSIRQHGLLHPITVRREAEGYEIVTGERRYRACQQLGMTRMDAFVLTGTPEECALLALIENLQREDLHYLEEAEAYADLLRQGFTQDELARRLGKSTSCIANKLRLLKLSPALRRLLLEEGLTERHARALLSLPDEGERLRAAHEAAQGHLTVRETEALVAEARKRQDAPPPVRRMISLVRDHRLYFNAIQDIVTQMRQSGLPAEMTVDDQPDRLFITIRLPKG